MTYHIDPEAPCTRCAGSGWIAVDVDDHIGCPDCEAEEQAIMAELGAEQDMLAKMATADDRGHDAAMWARVEAGGVPY